MSTDLDQKLTSIFDADRAQRRATEAFFDAGDERARVEAIGRAVAAAAKIDDEEESAERLMRAGDLLGEIGGAAAVALLLELLNHDEPAVRVSAGESLLELGHSRFAEVARAFEKAIESGAQTNALAEVPYILAEIGEAGGVKLCTKLLGHADANVVGAAIESLAALGDPAAIKHIEKLTKDKRAVPQEEELDTGEVTVGELAAEAIEHLRTLRV